MPGSRGARRRLRWWMVPTAVVLVALVGGAVGVILFVVRDDPAAKSVDEALEDFRSGGTDVARPSGMRPPVGVYELIGEGKETISFPPLEQHDGSTMPMTVAAADEGDCWILRIDYNEAHWQDWNLCADGEAVVETEGRTFQRWDVGAADIANLSTFGCAPPSVFARLDAEPAMAFDRSCVGTNEQIAGSTTSTGRSTFVGTDTVVVNGVEIEARHYRYQNEFSGAQTGNETLDLWLAADDLLPLRGLREVRVDTDSPIGTITYTEEGSWRLTSTDPRR